MCFSHDCIWPLYRCDERFGDCKSEAFRRSSEACSLERAWLDKPPRHEREPKNQGANGTLKRGTTSRAYILARLDRDGHADVAAQVRARSISARAAAITAGILKPPSPLDRIRRLLPRLTSAERAQLKREL
jgi:hypothetical protein